MSIFSLEDLRRGKSVEIGIISYPHCIAANQSLNQQVWMFQRFTVVMEYEQKPVLPPPLIIFCHIYATCKWVTRNVSHQRFQYDNGLKLFLEKEDMERLYDFEEECVEGYFREQVSVDLRDIETEFSIVSRRGSCSLFTISSK